MCHGFEWELYHQARAREVERLKRENVETEGHKPTPAAPARPAGVPQKDEHPLPV